jgi:glycosyltransferase involved in cell wall biosynthesis
MKIIYLLNSLMGEDGWSRYGKDLANNAKKNGHEVICLVSENSDSDIKQVNCLKEPLKYICNPLLIYKTAKRVNSILLKHKPDIVHFICEPYVHILPFIKYKPKKTILTIHGTYSYIPVLINNKIKYYISKLLSKAALKKISRIISVSNYTKKHILKYVPEISKKITVITNWVDDSIFSLGDIAKDSSRKNILFVGGVKPRKGLKESIVALNSFYKKHGIDFVYSIVGNVDKKSNYFFELVNLVDQLNLSDKIRFIGRVSEKELRNYYSKADLFLMLTNNTGVNFEGFGLVYLEANAYGVPTIGSKNSGAIDAIIEGKTGFLVEDNNNVEEIKKILYEILLEEKIKSEDCVNWALENKIKNKLFKIFKEYEE